MKSITTLLRVKQREMDALKRQQGILEGQREEIHLIINGLANQLADELKAAQTMPDMAHFFGNYSATIKQRQEMMHGHLRRLEAELMKLSEQIRERFSEIKKYELVLANHQKRMSEAQRKRDQQAMDELAIRGYIRRHET